MLPACARNAIVSRQDVLVEEVLVQMDGLSRCPLLESGLESLGAPVTVLHVDLFKIGDLRRSDACCAGPD